MAIRKLHNIENAICFLVDTLRESGKNPKPVIFHSILVGFKLLELQQPEEVIVAGLLHDIVEDTNCTLNEVRKRFGNRVAQLVSALTSETSSKNYRERTKDSVRKILRIGKDAAVIRLVDAYDNLPHATAIKDKQQRENVLWKHRYFIQHFKRLLHDFPLFHRYQKLYEQIVSQNTKRRKI